MRNNLSAIKKKSSCFETVARELACATVSKHALYPCNVAAVQCEMASARVARVRRGDGAGQLLDHAADQDLVLALGHDPDHRLGARLAHPQPAECAQRRLGAAFGLRDVGRPEAPRGGKAVCRPW